MNHLDAISTPDTPELRQEMLFYRLKTVVAYFLVAPKQALKYVEEQIEEGVLPEEVFYRCYKMQQWLDEYEEYIAELRMWHALEIRGLGSVIGRFLSGMDDFQDAKSFMAAVDKKCNELWDGVGESSSRL